MRRWTCPTCNAGKLAPERPRKDDPRRYCAPCSEASGKLVERVCPALERERERRAAARARKRRRKSKRRAARREQERVSDRARSVRDGVDLQAELDRLWRLRVVRDLARAKGRARPPLKVYYKKTGGRYSGHAKTRRGGGIVLSLAPDLGAATACQVLAHELAHIVSRGHWHDAQFREDLCAICKAGYGVDVSPLAARRAYALDSVIVADMRDAGSVERAAGVDDPDVHEQAEARAFEHHSGATAAMARGLARPNAPNNPRLARIIEGRRDHPRFRARYAEEI